MNTSVLSVADAIVAMNSAIATYSAALQANAAINTAAASSAIAVPAFASGGSYGGGLALVGERGPELINFNRPGTIYNAGQTAAFGNNGNEMTEELKALRKEVALMRAETAATARSTASLNTTLRRIMPDGDAIAVRTAV